MLSKYKKQLREKGEIYVKVKVKTGAPKTKIKQFVDDVIKIEIAAKPVKGQANQELVKFLAREFTVAKKNIKIISGYNSRIKLIKIAIS